MLIACPTCRSVGSGESQFQGLLNGPDETVDGTSGGSVDCLVVSSNSAAVVRSLFDKQNRAASLFYLLLKHNN